MKRSREAAPFGWVEISEQGLQRLRRELEEKPEGVVDEMGLLAIHTGYADFFFPGTSVLHTRPRYLFFVCWNLLWLAKQHVTAASLGKRKDQADLWVTRLLVANEQDGIIGIRVYRDDPQKLPAQRVDFIYWTALRQWGFYQSDTARARARLFRHWQPKLVRRVGEGEEVKDDSVGDEHLAALHVPPPPDWWQSDEASELGLGLTAIEAQWLQTRLMALEDSQRGACLLAKAAELSGGQGPRTEAKDEDDLRPWNDPLIIEAARATGHEARLERARQASSLALYVRAIYAALVEWVATDDGNDTDEHRERLAALANDQMMRDVALGLALPALFDDVPRLPESLRRVLEHVQNGLRQVAAGDSPLDAFINDKTHRLFEIVERRRKGARARLPRTDAAAARRIDVHKLKPYDLDYRWRPVRNLLADLHRGLTS